MNLPDTRGLTVFGAACAYARAGIPTVPFDPFTAGKGKNCGNLLGRSDVRCKLGVTDTGKWYDHATTHVSTLKRWNRVLGGFQAIATSPGRFGSVVLDIDKPELFSPQFHQLAKATAHVITRAKRRGHYFFGLPLRAPAIGNPAFEWGEVRGLGGGIVLPPYPKDHRYVARAGKMLELPAELLSSFAEAGVVGPTVDLDTFCEQYSGNRYPHKLTGLLSLHNRKLDETSPHDAMREVLRLGLGEAKIGFIPARAVLDTLRARWNRSEREFSNLATWCASVVLASDSAAIEAMSRRGKGTDSRQYFGTLK